MIDTVVATIRAQDPVDAAVQACESAAGAVLIMREDVTYVREAVENDFFHDGIPRLFASTEAEAWADRDHDDVARLVAETAAAMELVGGVGDPRLVCRGPVLVVPEQMRRLADHLDRDRRESWGSVFGRVSELSCLYIAWMQRSAYSGAVVSEPVFRVVRTPGEIASVRLARLTLSDLARGYLGVVTDDDTLAFLQRTRPYGEADALADYVPAKTLMTASLKRPYDRMPRVQGWVAKARGRRSSD